MAHYAKVVNGIVETVIVAESEFFDTFVDDSPGSWVQTSYNTRAGEHRLGGTALRKNYAGIGFHYDGVGFYEPQPFPSWTLNSTTYQWECPVTFPNDGKFYNWNETDKKWDEVQATKDQ